MRVTLIYCGIGVAGFNPDRPIGDREGSWIGHGVASVGANAQASGHEVDLIDLRQLGGWDDLVERIQSNPAEVYGLSVSAVDHLYALSAVYHIRRALPQSRVIVGGIHPTIFPEKYDYRVIDTVVQGEGELTFVKLLKQIDAGQELPRLIRGEKPHLDTIPWVDRELFQYEMELSCFFAPDQKTPSVTMLAGRGCAFRCNYCQPAENAVFGKPYRMRSASNVVAELVYLQHRYGFKSVTFWDDTFTFSPEWIDNFCGLYQSCGFNATIAACSRADIICRNEAMVERLSSVGLDWFVIGLESGSQRLLDLIQKGTTVEQNKEAARICRKYGVKIFGTYMYGLPTETREDSLATARMIDEIQPEHASPFWFTPIPGTGLHDYCVTHGLLLDSTGDRTIERTGRFMPALRNIDYGYLAEIMQGAR